MPETINAKVVDSTIKATITQNTIAASVTAGGPQGPPGQDGAGVGSSLWGTITGTLASQSDLNTALNTLQTNINSLSTTVATKEPIITSSLTSKYWRGDKTFQTLNSDVVPEGLSNLYYSDARVQVNRLDQLAQPTSTLHMNSQLVSNLANPLSNQDAATKSYVDSVASGLNVKGSVIAATTTVLPNYTFSANTLTANANGAFGSIDSVSISLNDRILVKNETGGNVKYNGIYTLTQVGDGSNPWILTRATDADTSAEMPTGAYCFVTSGTVGAATGWVLTSPNPITLNTTSLTFTQFVGALTFTASGGIVLTSSIFSLDTSYAPTFNGMTLNNQLNVNTSGSSTSITVTDTGTNGANVKLAGNGGTTPNKYLRSHSGVFEIINSGYSAPILTVDDSGNMTAGSTITVNNPSLTSGLGVLFKHNTAYSATVGSGNELDLITLSFHNTQTVASQGEFYGIKITTDSDVIDSAAGISITNIGKSDAMYISMAGKSGATASSPTGIGLDMNRSGSGENSTVNTGRGIQIWDFSSTDQGMGQGPIGLYLNKQNNLNSDHRLAIFRTNRNAIYFEVPEGAGYDSSKPLMEVNNTAISDQRFRLEASGNAVFKSNVGALWNQSSGNQVYVQGTTANQLDLRMGASGMRFLDNSNTVFVSVNSSKEITLTTSGSTSSLTITDTGANGSNIKLIGNGGTTPNKYIRAQSGNFQILNSAYSVPIMTIDDNGNITASTWNGATIGVAYGGTGATTAINARSNLGAQAKVFLTVGQANADYITDGTDDDVQIQQALDALPSTGGEVFLQNYTFIVGSPIVINKSFVTLSGSGWNTILKAKVSLNNHIIKFDNTNFISSCIFKDFKIDGDKLDQTSGNGIDALGATTCSFNRILFTSVKDYCLHFNGRADNAFGSNNFITNCQFTNGAKRGIYIQRCDENKIIGNLFSGLTDYHIYDNSGTETIVGNTFVGGAGFSTGIGVYVLNTANTVINGNTFDALYQESIYLSGSNTCDIAGNFFSKVSGGDVTRSVIVIDNGAHNQFNGNTITGGAYYPYGIKEINGSSGTILGINYIDPGTSSSVLIPNAADSLTGNLTTSKSVAGTISGFNAINTATSGASFAGFYAEVDPGSTGDSYLQFSVNGVTDWMMGADNSDSDKFKIARSTDLGTNTFLTIDTSGNMNLSGNLTYSTGLQSQQASYIIFQSGSTYKAQNGFTHAIDYSGTNFYTVFNSVLGALTSGGRIFVRAGTYTTATEINISTSNITVDGEGAATIFTAANSANIRSVIAVTGSTTNIKLRKFTIDGNKANQTSGSGMYIKDSSAAIDSDYVFEDILIQNCKNDGLKIDTGNANGSMYFLRVHSRTNNGSGFNDLAVSDSVFDQCISETNAQHGFYVGGVDDHYSNCKAFYNGSATGNYHGYYVAGFNNYFDTCEAQDNYQSGFYTQNDGDATYGAQNCTFVNCSADSNNQSSNASYGVGFQIKNTKGWVLIGCQAFVRPYATFTQRLGVSLEGTTSQTQITNLQGSGNSTALYSNTASGAGNIFFGMNSSGTRAIIDGGSNDYEWDNVPELFWNQANPSISLYSASNQTLSIINGGGGQANLSIQNGLGIGGNALLSGDLTFQGTAHTGLILNSVTASQRNTITPTNGGLIYNSTVTQIQKYENSQWVDISKSPATKVIAPSGSGYAADYYPDGTADDVEIQAAIAAVSSLGSGIVEILEGTYIISAKMTIPSNVTVRGKGWNTIFQLGNSVNDTVFVNSGSVNIHFLDFAVDMNSANNTTINGKGGVKITGASDSSIERVKVTNLRHVQGQHNVGVSLTTCSNSVIKNCYIYNVGDYGIATNGLLQCQIIDNYIQNPAGHGIDMELGTISSANERNIGCTIARNTIFYDASETLTNQDGIKIGRCDGCIISNNTIYCTLENGKLGFYYAEDVAATGDNNFDRGNIFSNNTIYGFGQGLWLLGSLNDVIATNTITLPATASYGMQITVSTDPTNPTASEEMQITGNTIIQKTNTVQTSGGGITIYGNAHHINVSGNNIFNIANTGIQVVFGCTNISIVGNTIRDSMASAIHIGCSFGTAGRSATGASYNTVSGNNISGSSRISDTTYNDIEIWGASTYNGVVGNTINCPNANRSKFGVHEDGSSGTPDNNNIANNTIQGVSNGVLTINIVGTSTIASGNSNGGRGFEVIQMSTSGSQLRLFDNRSGISNPIKTLRSRSGNFQIIDNSGNNALLTIQDNGRIGGYNITSPTAWLHLPAGAATASGAPLKFTSGVLLTIPEDGAVNYDGSHLYFTIGSTRYQIDQQLSGSAVTSLTGTANQVLVNGTSGSATTGAVTLTTPQSIATSSTPTFAGLTLSGELDLTTSGSSTSFTLTDTGTNGANIKLVGNGGTTPNKYIRSHSGVLEILNSGYSASIFTLSDSGVITASSWNAGAITVNSTSANALAVGANGVTNPILNVDASVTSRTTGISLQGQAAGSGLYLQTISSGTNESLYLDAKGSGSINLNTLVGTGEIKSLTKIRTEIDSIANTSTDGIVLDNVASATGSGGAAQQWSPRLRFHGNGWQTNTSGSQSIEWIAEAQAFSGAANPSTNLVFSNQINSAGYNVHSSFKSSGAFDLATGGVFSINGTTVLSNNTLGSGVVTSSLTTVGTIGTGVWQGTLIGATYGGTGVNNGSNTITVNTNPAIFTFSGAYTLTVPATGTAALLATTNTFTAAQTMTIASAGNAVPLTINQNDTTNNPTALLIANTGSGVSLDITAPNIAPSGTTANLRIFTTNTEASDIGGSIAFGGYITGTSTSQIHGAISARKENATSANTRSYMRFDVGSSERMRIDSNGKVGFGGAGPSSSQFTYNISFLNATTATKTIGMERNTTSNTAGNSLTINSGGATSAATDKAGGNLILTSGIPTGLGYSYMQHQTYSPVNSSAVPLASGTTDGQLLDRFTIGAFKALTNNSAISLVNCTLASNTAIAVIISYTIEVFDGTNLQLETGQYMFQCANKGGVFSGNTATVIGSVKQFLGAGTLGTAGACVWAISGANPAVISLNANSSLTPSSGYPRISYNVQNLTSQAIAIQ